MRLFHRICTRWFHYARGGTKRVPRAIMPMSFHICVRLLIAPKAVRQGRLGRLCTCRFASVLSCLLRQRRNENGASGGYAIDILHLCEVVYSARGGTKRVPRAGFESAWMISRHEMGGCSYLLLHASKNACCMYLQSETYCLWAFSV